ncbi:SDR family oxidoreductase [bacterium LRH843]|nr:SDR family oxidoreductase [bacterium LRH843]
MKNLFSIKDKVIVITEASKGRGYQFAKRLVELGANIAICARNFDEIINAEAELTNLGGQVLSAQVDVTKSYQISEFIESVIKRFGKIDVLINNANASLSRLTEEMSEEDWDYIQDVNVKAPFLVSQMVGRKMIDQKYGSIIMISPAASSKNSGECTAQAALHQLTRSLACEWRKYNIRVNAIAPGYIKGDTFEETAIESLDEVPLNRVGEPDDLIGALLYLCSSASNYTTGQTIVIDGGKTIY